MIRAAWIDLDTSIVENIIVAEESDLLNPAIKKIPSIIDSNNQEIFLPVVIGQCKWSEDLGFIDLNGRPLDFSSNNPNVHNPQRSLP